MKNTQKNTNKNISHDVSFYLQEAYYLAKELESIPTDLPRRSQIADSTLCAAETAVLAARRSFGSMLEKPKKEKKTQALLHPSHLTGSMKVTHDGWTVIQLNTLLQNTRQRTTGYIEHSILELLRQWREKGGVLPWYQRAFTIIVEHTTRKNSSTDPDNKEWKAVTNALKGVLFEDDDSFTTSLILDTIWDGKEFTEVVILPYHEVTSYLSRRSYGR